MAETIGTALAEIARRMKADYVGATKSNNRILIPTGTLGAGVWQSGDPVDLVCLSENTAAIFWGVVEEAFEIPDFIAPKNAQLKIKCDEIKPAFGTNQLIIRYCPFSAQSDHNTPVVERILDLHIRSSTAEGRNLAMAQDTLVMNILERQSNAVEIRDLLRATYDRLYGWFIANGLLHRPSGYMDSEGLLYLLYTKMMAWNGFHIRDGDLPKEISLLEYFVHDSYMTFDHDLDITTPRGRCLSSHITSAAARTTQDVLRDLSHRVSSLDTALDVSTEQAYRDFVTHTPPEHQFFTFVTESYNVKTHELYTFINNLPCNLVTYMQTKPELHYRIWPHSVVHIDPSIGAGVHITYIVAISHLYNTKAKDLTTQLSQAENTLMAEALPGTIYKLTPVPSRQTLLTDTMIPQPLTTLSLKAPSHPQTHNISSHNDPTRPFRSAAKALSRALHDPAHHLTDFEVGYHDRFDGLLWMALAKWGHKATEDEDFIPEHRVQKLRRAHDGVVVWDRQERRDWL